MLLKRDKRDIVEGVDDGIIEDFNLGIIIF